MSRTRKGGKGSGHEYWSRRPFKGVIADPGRVTKKITHKMERAQAKQALKEKE